jgi:hypothetical protein
LKAFIDLDLFPDDITKSLKKTLLNPAATANGETALLLVLRRYNPLKKAGVVVLAHLADGTLFKDWYHVVNIAGLNKIIDFIKLIV